MTEPEPEPGTTTETQKARESLILLGGDLVEMYATFCPLCLADLSVRLEKEAPVLDFLDEAIERKADLKRVWWLWSLWLLEDLLVRYSTSAPVAVLLRRECADDHPTIDEWRKAEDDAWRVRVAEAGKSTPGSNGVNKASWAAETAGFLAGWVVKMTTPNQNERRSANIVIFAAEAAKAKKGQDKETRVKMAEKLARLLSEATP